MFLYNWFAVNWKWTPRQVDELTLEEIYWLPTVESARQEAVRQISNAKG